ncbi:aldose 1-epimerase [Nitzschia inconspicua]|nr:aldose 1-epimerase [Nitzschia inconspicua]
MSNIRIVTHSASGASCKIHDFGACLISYQTGAGRECLFVSRDAKMDGSKAIRGGVPLVFPQFGQPDKSMPQHGFLRTNYWTVDESSAFDTKESAGITYTLQLKDAKAARGGIWDEQTMFDCTCLYHVMIDGTKLTTTLEIQNTSTKRFFFQALLHTYYFVDGKQAMDGSKCYVKGLEGYSVIDKVSNTEYISGSDPTTIQGETDRVYNPPVGKDMVEVTIGVGKGKELKLTAVGTVDGKKKPVSCVVWNPYIEKARGLSDFGDDQYQEMICVEPGILGETQLEGGSVSKLTQVVEML